MDIENDISRIYHILHVAREETPHHLRGLLIPEAFINEFMYLIGHFTDLSRDEKKWREQIFDGYEKSQKSTHEFITTLCKGISDGDIKFG